MPIDVPPEVLDAISALDRSTKAIDAIEAENALRGAMPDPTTRPIEYRTCLRAELAIFEEPGHAPEPDANVAADLVAHWQRRAQSVTHPFLSGRYALAAWRLRSRLPASRRGEVGIGVAHIAIDALIAASALDDGQLARQSFDDLARALSIAVSISDTQRTAAAASAVVEFAKRCDDAEGFAASCALDILGGRVPPRTFSVELVRDIVSLAESRLGALAASGDAFSHDEIQRLGQRLAAHYARISDAAQRSRVEGLIARALETRASIGDALMRMWFLKEARAAYAKAGLSKDADRVQRELDLTMPTVRRHMAPISDSAIIPDEDMSAFLERIVPDDLTQALREIAREFVPSQDGIRHAAEQLAKVAPMYALFEPHAVLVSDERIVADLSDTEGDDDGLMVHRTQLDAQLGTVWLSAAFDRSVTKGLDASRVLSFIAANALFSEDRIQQVRRGLHAHFAGEYDVAVHMLLPQIERALSNSLGSAGQTTSKPSRTGRGVSQAKLLNDILKRGTWPDETQEGEDVRMYLQSVLNHPKGINIRNEVSHGLWSNDRFAKEMSELVLHCLLVVAQMCGSSEPRR